MLLDKLRKQRAKIIAVGRRYGARRIRVRRSRALPGSLVDSLLQPVACPQNPI